MSQLKYIGDVCTVIAGQSPEGKFYNSDGRGMPFYQGKKEFNEKYIGEPTTWTTKITKESIDGDILMSVRAPVGPVNISTQKICIGRGLAAIRPSEKLNRDYLFYFLLMYESQIVGNTGAVFNSINKAQIEKIQLPVPSMTEQKQIVSILDEAFEAIDKAKSNLQKNIENAKELFQAKLDEVFSQSGKGWDEKPLGELSKIMYGYTDKTTNKGNVKYLRITDIQDGAVNWEETPSINISNEEKSKFILKKGDIVFARTGATTGKSFLIESCPPAVFASYLIRVQCDILKLEPSFLYMFFQSRMYWNMVNAGISGSAQGGFNASKLAGMLIHYPVDKGMQSELVRKIKELKEPFDELVLKYQNKLVSFEELKKSILQMAFAGELVKIKKEFSM